MNFIPGRPGFSQDHQMSNSTYHQHNGGAQPPDYSNGDKGCVSAAPHLVVLEKEHMFDKVVTPSDVGKLNRLVIPKQHAEKHFPLDSSTNEKGLLLNFEDRTGKPWRFRYSYWNSSQSYVMTKGWSRFVKEKKLDAGDIVSFQRGAGELGKDRLFIDWRRRPDAPEFPTLSLPPQFYYQPWNHHPLFLQPPPSREYSHFVQTHYPNNYTYGSTSHVVNGNHCPPFVYLRSAPGGVFSTQRQRGGEVERMVFESVPVVQGKAAAKRLRLFGVNMDCPISESDDECDVLSHSIMPLQLLPPPDPDSTIPYRSNDDCDK